MGFSLDWANSNGSAPARRRLSACRGHHRRRGRPGAARRARNVDSRPRRLRRHRQRGNACARHRSYPAVEGRAPCRSRGRLPRASRTGRGARCVRSSSWRFRRTRDLGNASVRRRPTAVVTVFATPTDGPQGRGFCSRASQWHTRPPRRSRIERATPRLQRAFANPGNNGRRTVRLQRSAHSTAGGVIKWRPCVPYRKGVAVRGFVQRRTVAGNLGVDLRSR